MPGMSTALPPSPAGSDPTGTPSLLPKLGIFPKRDPVWHQCIFLSFLFFLNLVQVSGPGVGHDRPPGIPGGFRGEQVSLQTPSQYIKREKERRKRREEKKKKPMPRISVSLPPSRYHPAPAGDPSLLFRSAPPQVSLPCPVYFPEEVLHGVGLFRSLLFDPHWCIKEFPSRLPRFGPPHLEPGAYENGVSSIFRDLLAGGALLDPMQPRAEGTFVGSAPYVGG